MQIIYTTTASTVLAQYCLENNIRLGFIFSDANLFVEVTKPEATEEYTNVLTSTQAFGKNFVNLVDSGVYAERYLVTNSGDARFIFSVKHYNSLPEGSVLEEVKKPVAVVKAKVNESEVVKAALAIINADSRVEMDIGNTQGSIKFTGNSSYNTDFNINFPNTLINFPTSITLEDGILKRVVLGHYILVSKVGTGFTPETLAAALFQTLPF